MILPSWCPTILAYVSTPAAVVADDLSNLSSGGCAISCHVSRNFAVKTSDVLDIIFDYRRWSLRCWGCFLLILRECLLWPPIVVLQAFVVLETVLWPHFGYVFEKWSVRWLTCALVAVSFKARGQSEQCFKSLFQVSQSYMAEMSVESAVKFLDFLLWVSTM